MKYLIALLGLLVVFFLAFIASFDKKGVPGKIRTIIILLITELIFAFILTRTSAGVVIIAAISNGFEKLLSFANTGTYFVFGDLVNKGGYNFLLGALMPAVFICALIGVLKYLKILPIIIRLIGAGLHKINNMGKLESYSAIGALVLGMTTVFVAIKEPLGKVDKHRLYTISAASMSSVDLSILAAYMYMIQGKYVLLAIILNLFNYFIICSIINPYKVLPEQDVITVTDTTKQGEGLFSVMADHIMDGFKIIGAVAAMLIAFVALVDLINSVFNSLFGHTFQDLVGLVFSPLAFLTGIPWHESQQIGGIMAIKLVTNEFVAMQNLVPLLSSLSERSAGIISVFLVSFANIGSVGIVVGAMNSLHPHQARHVANFAMRLLYGASLVSLLSAMVVGIML